MSYKPTRHFDGQQGEASVDSQGPEQLSKDLDEINKMFDPSSKHDDGTNGGISKENLAFTITNDYDNTEKSHVATAYEHANTTGTNPHSTPAKTVPIDTIEGIATATTVQKGLEEITKREMAHEGDYAGAIDYVTYNKTPEGKSEQTGKFRFYKVGDHTTPVYTIDTPLEKLVVNFKYDRANRVLVLTYPDGTTDNVDLADLVTEYDFVNSENINFSVSGHEVSAVINPSYMENMEKLEKSTEENADLASRYAKGKDKSGADAQSGTAGYQDNALYYKNQAGNSANAALTSQDLSTRYAVGKDKDGKDAAEGTTGYHDNSLYYKGLAEDAANKAVTASVNTPIIGSNGNWYTYNQTTKQYEDTGLPSRGYTPIKGTDYFTEADKAEIETDIIEDDRLVEVSDAPTTGKFWVGEEPTEEEFDIYTSDEVDNKLSKKQDKLIAGEHIKIAEDEKTISVEGVDTAEDIAYDSTKTYSDGTVGKELTSLSNKIASLKLYRDTDGYLCEED